jgi:hypothetical protein
MGKLTVVFIEDSWVMPVNHPTDARRENMDNFRLCQSIYIVVWGHIILMDIQAAHVRETDATLQRVRSGNFLPFRYGTDGHPSALSSNFDKVRLFHANFTQ